MIVTKVNMVVYSRKLGTAKVVEKIVERFKNSKCITKYKQLTKKWDEITSYKENVSTLLQNQKLLSHRLVGKTNYFLTVGIKDKHNLDHQRINIIIISEEDSVDKVQKQVKKDIVKVMYGFKSVLFKKVFKKFLDLYVDNFSDQQFHIYHPSKLDIIEPEISLKLDFNGFWKTVLSDWLKHLFSFLVISGGIMLLLIIKNFTSDVSETIVLSVLSSIFIAWLFDIATAISNRKFIITELSNCANLNEDIVEKLRTEQEGVVFVKPKYNRGVK